MNKYILIPLGLVASLAQGSTSLSYGLLWMDFPRTPGVLEQKKTERALRDVFENHHHIRLVPHHLSLGFSQQTLAYEQAAQELRSINADIVDLLRSEHPGITHSSSDFLKKLEIQHQRAKKLPRFFYAPEIAQTKLLQALGYWKFKNKAQRHQKLFHETRGLHPLGLFHWSEEAKPLWWDAFEIEVNTATHATQASCPIQRDDWLERAEKLWGNGFILHETPSHVIPGVFLFVIKSRENEWYEKLVLCRQGRPITLRQAEWVPLRQHLRLEQGLDTPLTKYPNFIVLSQDHKKVNTYLYSLREGLRPWSEDHFIARNRPEPLKLNDPSFPLSEPPKWYNKTAIWAVAAAALSGAITWTVQRSSQESHRAAVQVKIIGGP
ncbi:hypothetical protein EBR03_05140 [bacterium]|nr:hypothetical protein [bacterium]NBW98938.1 hypothetical protein [bacterium]NBX81715.1 hypothetical protein [bacterium]